jgi:hypothetical protein
MKWNIVFSSEPTETELEHIAAEIIRGLTEGEIVNEISFNEASDDLNMFVQQAMDGNEDAVPYLKSLWDGESWDSIKEKLETEGSAWVVWWNDGVCKHMQNYKDNH